MPSLASSNDESRTSSLGTKRSVRKPKSRRKRLQQLHKESGLVASDSSALSNQAPMSSNPNATDRTAMTDLNQLPNMAQGLGNNRLASGFIRRPATTTDQIENTSMSDPSPGESADSPIEISSDEDMEDAGGMVINLQGQENLSLQETSGGGTSDAESGEYISSSASLVDQQNQEYGTAPQNATSLHNIRRLADLTQDQLEEQIIYGFYFLERDQIDLNRPVVCLQCSTEGHVGVDCPEKFTVQNPFPVVKIKSDGHMKLWISCCVCASKSHLVGDCPRADKTRATRWSLASLDPNQITNLSQGSGMSKLETEAGNRGMRPPGLQIRGHAGRHTAGYGRQLQDSSEEDFLPSRRSNQNNSPADRNSRYDRFAGPPDQSANRARSGGPWYNTDSFGRRRSRSPMSDQNFNRNKPPPASRARDDFRAPARNHNNNNNNNNSKDARHTRMTSPPSRRNISIQLPARPNFNSK